MLAKVASLFKKALIVLLCLFAVFAGMLFAYENPDKISPVFWGVPFPPLSLGYYLIFIFLLGLVMGVLVAFWGGQRKARVSRRETSKLKKQLKELESPAKTPA